jgi:hypothetical protein
LFINIINIYSKYNDLFRLISDKIFLDLKDYFLYICLIRFLICVEIIPDKIAVYKCFMEFNQKLNVLLILNFTVKYEKLYNNLKRG